MLVIYKMKSILNYFTRYNKNYILKTEISYQPTLASRKILMIKVAFWMGGAVHLFYCVRYLLSDQPQLSYNALTLLISCALSYYFLKKNNLAYSTFFAYYPAIFTQVLICYQEAHTNLNGELALIAYAAIPVVCCKFPYDLIGILINYLLFIFVKIFKYPLHSITIDEFYNEIIMVTCIYVAIFLTSYFHKIDYLVLKESIKELNIQKQIINAQAEKLEVINSTKNQLFIIIAHDLRSPLSSLKGVMQLIDDEHINQEEFKDLSKRLQSDLDNIFGMLDNLLLWSQSQMEGIKPNLAPFDLNFIIDETMLTFRESAMQKQVSLINNSAINLQAFGDEYKIKIVLSNLLNNAIKFTPSHGQITIDSSIKGKFINLQITDSGVGIERNDLAKIFTNPKLKTGTAGEKGTGFGLFLCKELIEKNGGTIEVNSEFGKGTTIDILLPLMLN